MKPSILAVDLSNQVYRAIYAHPNLTSNGVFTGGIYGLLTQIATALRITGCERVVLLEDTKPYVRSRAYPSYKSGRSGVDEGVLEARNESLSLARKMAKAVGIPVWSVPGYEADDLAGLLCTNHRHRYDLIWSMSNDSDLWQLFWCDNYRVLSFPPQSAKVPPVVHSPESFARDFGISPEQYVTMLALSGTHNAVEGIPTIGKKRSLEAVRDNPDKLRALQDKHGDLIARNIELIRLPHPSLPRKPPLEQWRGADLRALYRFCDDLDINVTPAMASSFGNLAT